MLSHDYVCLHQDTWRHTLSGTLFVQACLKFTAHLVSNCNPQWDPYLRTLVSWAKTMDSRGCPQFWNVFQDLYSTPFKAFPKHWSWQSLVSWILHSIFSYRALKCLGPQRAKTHRSRQTWWRHNSICLHLLRDISCQLSFQEQHSKDYHKLF